MLHQDIEAETLVSRFRPQDENRVLGMLGWDHLPYELSRPGQGFCMWLLREDDADRAIDHLSQHELDVLIVDEDYFGFPEDVADVCLSVRRMHPDIRIVVIESELSDCGSILGKMGLCDTVLPAGADARSITDELALLL
jgi:hypothetical protein